MKFLALQSSKKDSLDYCNLYARVRHGEHNKKYALGLKVRISEWEKYKSGHFVPSEWLEGINISYAQFDLILSSVKELLEGDFNPDTAIEEIKKIREGNMFVKSSKKKASIYKEKYFTSYMQTYIESLRNGTRCKHKRDVPVSAKYLMQLESTLKKIRLFEEENCKLLLNHMDMKFRSDFMAWCFGKNYSENSVISYLSSIRIVMKSAYAEKLTKSNIHLSPDFVPTAEQTDNVYLTTEQIEEMFNFDLNTPEAIAKIKEIHMRMFERDNVDSQHLGLLVNMVNKARDIFVAGCLTGQRESDYMRYNKDMITTINDSRFLKVKQVKTQKTVLIPLDRRVEFLLDKYGGEFPTVCTCYFNRYIHIVCEVLGWTWIPRFDNINKSIKTGNRFCDLVCSHTARRSFATNAYKSGVPLSSIMAVTGHAREDGVRRYLKLSTEEKAIIADKDMDGFMDL